MPLSAEEVAAVARTNVPDYTVLRCDVPGQAPHDSIILISRAPEFGIVVVCPGGFFAPTGLTEAVESGFSSIIGPHQLCDVLIRQATHLEHPLKGTVPELSNEILAHISILPPAEWRDFNRYAFSSWTSSGRLMWRRGWQA